MQVPTTSAPPTLATMGGRLWRCVPQLRRRQFGLLLVLMVLASFAEVLSIGAVLPFLGALSAPDKVFSSRLAQPIVKAFGLTAPSDIILPLTIAFCLAGLVAGGMRILLLSASLKVSFGVGADISNDVYRRTLYQSYATHVARNSSEIINGISIKTNEVIFYIVMPVMTLASAAFMAVAIILALSWFIPGTALAAFGFFGALYVIIVKRLRSRLKRNSEHIAVESTNSIRHLQEGLGGIRDILIDGTQEVFCNTFRETDRILRKAQSNNQFMALSPRFAMESLGMVLIAVVAFGMSRRADGVAQVIPVLAALALGLQRLLPALQQGYQAWSTIQGAEASLADTLVLLEQPLPANLGIAQVRPLPFKREIRLEGVSFRYAPTTPLVLQDIDVVIPKGSRIGFIGTTGSGKSTLVDIVMGLLVPTAGRLAVDGQTVSADNVDAWRSQIAHVPQNIFLADSSVAENIAFGVPRDEIDMAAVRAAAEQARIGATVESWANGYDTPVGERGVQLSGGQRQRIGIARALYKKAEVIIFDEATSALDTGTEQAVMQAIDDIGGEVTILLIAHRLSTLRNCTRVVELGVHQARTVDASKARDPRT